MQKLIMEVKKIAMNELERANCTFPLFHSNHEGIAVIEEELLEAEREMNMLSDKFKWLKKGVYRDESMLEVMAHCREARESAINAAAELIQTAAMCEKFNMSEKGRGKKGK